jgi:DNA-binding LacI/PurR family transcriptional regulator
MRQQDKSLATTSDGARYAGVSKDPVSQGLSEPIAFSNATRTRAERAIRVLDYRLSETARGLTSPYACLASSLPDTHFAAQGRCPSSDEFTAALHSYVAPAPQPNALHP